MFGFGKKPATGPVDPSPEQIKQGVVPSQEQLLNQPVETQKGGAAAFIASINTQSAADEKTQNDHVDLSQARAFALVEEFFEWSKTQPFIQTLGDKNVEENALGDVAGAMIIALASFTAQRKPGIPQAMACAQQFGQLFLNAYMAFSSKAP